MYPGFAEPAVMDETGNGFGIRKSRGWWFHFGREMGSGGA